jgi:hypothetical protein
MALYLNGKFDCKRDIMGSEVLDLEKYPVYIGKPIAAISGFEKGFDGLLSDMRYMRK